MLEQEYRIVCNFRGGNTFVYFMGEPEDTIFYPQKVCVFIRVGVAATVWHKKCTTRETQKITLRKFPAIR